MKSYKIFSLAMFIGVFCSLSAQKIVSKKGVTEVKGNSAMVAGKQGRDVRITGSNLTKSVTMDGGNLSITADSSTITVLGAVNKISVQGSNVTVNADHVNAVDIIGADVHVFYKSSGNKNGRATASITGVDSGVSKK